MAFQMRSTVMLMVPKLVMKAVVLNARSLCRVSHDSPTNPAAMKAANSNTARQIVLIMLLGLRLDTRAIYSSMPDQRFCRALTASRTTMRSLACISKKVLGILGVPSCVSICPMRAHSQHCLSSLRSPLRDIISRPSSMVSICVSYCSCLR